MGSKGKKSNLDRIEEPTETSRSLEIREAVVAMADRPFGWDGDDGLPMRQDVRQFIMRVMDLCDGFLPGIATESRRSLLGGMPAPWVVMNRDGTIEVRFSKPGHQVLVHPRSLWNPEKYKVFPAKNLTLWFPCDGVTVCVRSGEGRVIETLHVGDDAMSACRYLDGLDEAFGWMIDD